MRITRKKFFKTTAAKIANPYLGWRCIFFGLLRVSEDCYRTGPPIR